MRPYFFHFKVTPAPDSTNTKAGTHAHIWVMDVTLDAAREHAINRIANDGWQLSETLLELQPDQEQLAQLLESEGENHRKALANGWSIDYRD